MDNYQEISKNVEELVAFVCEWEEKVKKLKDSKSLSHDEAHHTYYSKEYHQACQNILNDLGELFFSEGRVNVCEVEKIILLNLDRFFTRLKVADISGLSIRTVRNKLNERV